ncbi:hypothetical protein A4X09_0g1536 [Tilletia walkeri]|uniref:Uncharacterized protein n=1 Tax=Tilletia walkeri TaxID=117179 RepID=A0A8X7NBC3_9BASI|nr:hypothetical protein A4X09_0g1536 [Tilletia walkeri]
MDIGFLQQICESATPRDFLGKLAELRQSIYHSASLSADTSTSSTKDYLDDYHGGTKPGDRRSLASSTSSDHSVGEISLDRLRAAADAADSANAGDTSVASNTSTDTALGSAGRPQTVCCCGKEACEKAQKAGGELEGIMENVEFGRQIFAELIDTFTKLQIMKVEAEEAKVKAEEQLSDAKQRVQDLEERADRNRYASPPPSAWPPVSPGEIFDSPQPEIVRARRTSASHQLPRRPGRPSTGRTISSSVPFGGASASSSSTDIAAAAGNSGSTPVLGSEATFNSRSSTPSIPNADLPNLPSASDFRIIELETTIQTRDNTIEHLNSRVESQADEFQRKIDEQEGAISSLQQACEKAQTDARKAEDYWGMFEEQVNLREEREKEIKDLQDDKHALQLDIERLASDVETWETRANELEKKERETNGQALALKGLLEKKKDEVNELHKENKALTQDKDRLTRTVSALQVEDNLSNKLKAQLQEEASKLSTVQTELRFEKSRNNELEGDLARLKIEFEAKEGELAEAQQMNIPGAGGAATGSLRGSDGYASYGKSIASQLAAAAAKEKAEADMQERPMSPDDGNVSQDTDTDRSYEEIVTTVVKKRVPRRKGRTASSPLLDIFEPARDDGNESDGSVSTQMAGPSRRRAPSSSEDDPDSEVENDDAPARPDDTISTITSLGSDTQLSGSRMSHVSPGVSQHAKVTRAWLHSVARLVPSGTVGMMHGVWPGSNQDKDQNQQPVIVAATVSLLVGMAIGTFVIGNGLGGADDAGSYGETVMLGLFHHHAAVLPESTSARFWRVLFGSTKIMRRTIAY